MDKYNLVFYFLSTTAQVWAALIAFGGIAIRDRVRQFNDACNLDFQCAKEEAFDLAQVGLKGFPSLHGIQHLKERNKFFEGIESLDWDAATAHAKSLGQDYEKISSELKNRCVSYKQHNQCLKLSNTYLRNFLYISSTSLLISFNLFPLD